MRLKKLELFGFKSFADKTTLNFDRGITGIVGPNGCGKSNVADAFRWVFGEQSAKSMRGGKMHDVIFAGTSQRKALGLAEVSITLTDIQGSLPIDYEEVTVTRRLYRDGQGEYLLNRHPVRLKDLYGLFMDSGCGKDSFAIMEQGKVDEIINLSPKERRYILEEAAGILRFLERKRETLKRLEQTQNNMSRIQDIYAEVEKQVKTLERQARDARVFQEKKSTLERLEKALFVTRWTQAKKSLVDAVADEGSLMKALQEVRGAVEALSQQLSTQKGTLSATEETLKKTGELVYKAKSDKELCAQADKSQKSRIQEALDKKKALEEEIKALEDAGKAFSGDVKEKAKALAALQKNVDKAEKELSTFRATTATLKEAFVASRAKQQKAQNAHLKSVQEESRLAGEIKELGVRQHHELDKLETLKKRYEDLKDSIGAVREAMKAKKQKVDAVLALVEGKKKALEAMEKQQNEETRLRKALEDSQKDLSKAMTQAEARQRALSSLQQEREGMSSGTKRLLKEASLTGKVRPLYEVVATEGKGLAKALRHYGQTLAVATKKDRDALLAFANDKGIREFSLWCEGKNGASHFLHTLHKAKDVQEALEIVSEQPGTEAWTEDGYFVDARQVVFSFAEGEGNPFVRDAEIKELAGQIQSYAKEIKALDGKISEALQKGEHLRKQRLDLDQEIRKEEMTLVEVNFGLQQATRQVVDMEKEQVSLVANMEAMKEAREKAAQALKNLEKRYHDAQKAVVAAEKETYDVAEALQKNEESLNDKQKDLSQREEAFQTLYRQRQELVNAVEVLKVKEGETVARKERLVKEVQDLLARQEGIKGEQQQNTKTLGDTEKVLAKAVREYEKLEKDVLQSRKSIDALSQTIEQKRTHLASLEKKQVQLTAAHEQTQNLCETYQQEIVERYGITIEEAAPTVEPLEDPVADVEKEVKSLRRAIEQTTDVNMTSIDEFDKSQERYKFLKGQLQDLTQSKDELVGIIGNLDDESRGIFKDVFEKIRTAFRKNFEILFKGGEADLRFTDSNDVLEAGIDIVAKPPGKQMRSIHLLSGGEKCLTAVALLFAIFEVKPSPFCILDEIDAPLDDSNVERFLNVVTQYVDRCQFIMITHNKRSMAIADQLLGVSMEEKGVSKLLSVRFHKNREEKKEIQEVAVLGANA